MAMLTPPEVKCQPSSCANAEACDSITWYLELHWTFGRIQNPKETCVQSNLRSVVAGFAYAPLSAVTYNIFWVCVRLNICDGPRCLSTCVACSQVRPNQCQECVPGKEMLWQEQLCNYSAPGWSLSKTVLWQTLHTWLLPWRHAAALGYKQRPSICCRYSSGSLSH